MNWLQPLAWIGAASIVLPVLVHFFTRTRARSLPFPSLRFLPRTRLVPTWSRRPSDLWLMMVRVLVLSFAVAALARPVLTAGVSGSSSTSRARFVLVDTSWSVHRGDSSSRREFDSLARVLADSAAVSRVGFTGSPRGTLAGAAAWLERIDAGDAEVVVLSDFQRASLDSSDLASISSALGVRLVRVPVSAQHDSLGSTVPLRLTDGVVNLSFDAGDAGTTVRYSKAIDSSRVSDIPIEFTGVTAEEEAALRSIRNYAGAVAQKDPLARQAPSIVMHFPGDSTSARMSARLSPIARSSLRSVVALATDETIRELAPSVIALRSSAEAVGRLNAITHNDAGAALLQVGMEGDSRFHVFVNVSPQSAFAGAVVAALVASTSGSIALAEFDRAQIPNASLEVLQRPAAKRESISSGRELAPAFWLLALVALLAEMLLRNRRSAAPAEGTNSVSAAA